MTANIGCDYSGTTLYLACVEHYKVLGIASVELANPLVGFLTLQTTLGVYSHDYNAFNIYIEQPWVDGQRFPRSGMMLQRSATFVEIAALSEKLDVTFVHPGTWRKKLLGNGRPKDAKDVAIEYVQEQLKYQLPVMGKTGRGQKPDHNFADAICIATYGGTL